MEHRVHNLLDYHLLNIVLNQLILILIKMLIDILILIINNNINKLNNI